MEVNKLKQHTCHMWGYKSPRVISGREDKFSDIISYPPFVLSGGRRQSRESISEDRVMDEYLYRVIIYLQTVGVVPTFPQDSVNSMH